MAEQPIRLGGPLEQVGLCKTVGPPDSSAGAIDVLRIRLVPSEYLVELASTVRAGCLPVATVAGQPPVDVGVPQHPEPI